IQTGANAAGTRHEIAEKLESMKTTLEKRKKLEAFMRTPGVVEGKWSFSIFDDLIDEYRRNFLSLKGRLATIDTVARLKQPQIEGDLINETFSAKVPSVNRDLKLKPSLFYDLMPIELKIG